MDQKIMEGADKFRGLKKS